jgi:hypothetical protein
VRHQKKDKNGIARARNGRQGQNTANNKQSKHRAQSRPRPSANCRFDGSVGVHSVAKPPSGTVMSPMRQLLAFVKRGVNPARLKTIEMKQLKRQFWQLIRELPK